MVYLIIAVSVLTLTLIVLGVVCIKKNQENTELNSRISDLYRSYSDVVYSNCLLGDKIERLKSLSLDVTEDIQYYKQLLASELE